MRAGVDLRWVFEQFLEGLSGVQQVVAELGGQLAQLLLNLIEPLPSGALHPSSKLDLIEMMPGTDCGGLIFQPSKHAFRVVGSAGCG